MPCVHVSEHATAQLLHYIPHVQQNNTSNPFSLHTSHLNNAHYTLNKSVCECDVWFARRQHPVVGAQQDVHIRRAFRTLHASTGHYTHSPHCLHSADDLAGCCAYYNQSSLVFSARSSTAAVALSFVSAVAFWHTPIRHSHRGLKLRDLLFKVRYYHAAGPWVLNSPLGRS